MDAAEKDKILNKLKKMLEIIARDPDGHEGKTASKMAAKIMATYGLTKEDLKVTADDGTANITGEDIDIDNADKDWELLLLSLCRDFFDVKVMVKVKEVKVGKATMKLHTSSFLGFKHDMELATWYYKYLRLVVSRKSELHSRAEHIKMAFAQGMINAIYKRFEEIQQAKEAARNKDVKDLVLYKGALLDEIMGKLYPDTKPMKSKGPENREAFEQGWKEGKKISLGRPIGPADPSERPAGVSSGPIAIE